MQDMHSKCWLYLISVNPLSVNPTKWSNTLKQFIGNFTNRLSVFDHFVGFALKRVKHSIFNLFNERISCHWFLSISPENIRKPQKTSGFLMFSGGIERDQWHEKC